MKDGWIEEKVITALSILNVRTQEAAQGSAAAGATAMA
jgi:hypothetical protein